MRALVKCILRLHFLVLQMGLTNYKAHARANQTPSVRYWSGAAGFGSCHETETKNEAETEAEHMKPKVLKAIGVVQAHTRPYTHTHRHTETDTDIEILMHFKAFTVFIQYGVRCRLTEAPCLCTSIVVHYCR